jgi:hypothetical protein
VRPKKNRQAFRRWRFSLDSGLSLAGPVRQQAGEVEKEETEEPALHGRRLNHSGERFGKSRVSDVTTAARAETNRIRNGGRVLFAMYESLYLGQQPGANDEVELRVPVADRETVAAGDRYGDVALGVESAWPARISAP